MIGVGLGPDGPLKPKEFGSIPSAPALVMITEILASIDAPHFVAGVVLWDDKVIEAAPIIGYMKKQKWTRDRVRDYCKTKGWKVSVIYETKRQRTFEGKDDRAPSGRKRLS